ncbi:MAG: DinB family protein [Candidatus Acidiferrales bacterium]
MNPKNSRLMWIAGATALSGILAIAAIEGLSAKTQQQGRSPLKNTEEKIMTTQPGFYCNLNAITPSERIRHGVLSWKLKEARIETKELADGYAFRLDNEKVSIANVADWIANERKCCPFFDFEVELGREGGPLWLKLRGNDGVKQFIVPELGVAQSQTENPEAQRLTRVTMSQAIDEWVTKTEQLVVPAAEAMPEEKYSFAPTNGEFAGVRTFAEQVKHLSASNYQLAALSVGEKPPHDENGEKAPAAVKSKAEIVEYLKGSYTYLHKVVAAIDEKNAAEQIEWSRGKNRSTRIGLLVDAIAHSQNHYGQMVEYLRMNGIVPPASR